MTESGQLKIIGGRRSHDTLRRVMTSRTPCRVLDAPAGTGVLAVFLDELGFEVHCADIDAGNFEVAERFPFETVDLNQRLPYGDASFDAVVCANGLHRLANPAGAVSEFFRILRPGGSLYVTVNHYGSLERRLRFLFTGSLDNNLDKPEFVQTKDIPEASVRQPLLYPFLANLLEARGFAIVDVQASQLKKSRWLLLPVTGFVWLGSFFVKRRTRRSSRVRETRSSALLPGGRYFFLEAKRP